MLSMEKINSLTLVVPTFKQERTIEDNLTSLQEAVKNLPFNTEIIIVVDGFLDKTYSILKKKQSKYLKVVGYEKNRGKGFAVRSGMLEAKGDIIGFIDGGMDIDPTGISLLINHMIWYDADVIIGSKLHPVSQVNYPFFRKVMSWGYRSFIRILFGLRIRDSQVGLKLFKKKVVKDVFPRILVKNYAFDIEVLAVAHAMGYKRIYEGPIRLNFNQNSSINSSNFWKVIALMLWDTLAVFYRLKILHFYDKPRSNFK